MLKLSNPLKGKPKAVIALIIISVILLSIAVAFAIGPYIISTVGHVNAPAELSLSTNTIDWGTLDPGDQTTSQVTITNIGENPTGTLSFSASPPVGTIAWDVPAGTTLDPAEEITVTFTLTVSGSAPTGDFSFDITITA